jgi:galactoside O-acetyltransferase
MLYDMAGVDIADDVMIGPNVNIITSGHPLELSKRRAHVEAKPIAIEKNVWIAAGATMFGQSFSREEMRAGSHRK